MDPTTTIRDRSADPRDRITPHAFSVAPELLGLPLATHPRRVSALLVDLLLVALLAAGVGGVLLGLVLAVLFFRVALRGGRTDRGELPLPALALRSSAGCVGGLILLVTVISVWGGVQTALRLGDPAPPPPVPGREVVLQPGVFDVFEGAREVQRFRAAESQAEAREAARELARHMQRIGMSEEELREFLRDVAPDAADWRAAIAEWDLDEPDPPEAEEMDPGVSELQADLVVADTVPREELVQALEAYAELLRELDAEAAEEETPAWVLRERIAAELASDTIEALQQALSEEADSRLRAERALFTVEDREPGIRAWLRSIAEDLGIGFGWGAVYFSVFLVWWNGRTPGKRVFGLRVVRLDGQPITWWTAFERYGGYAAGFATGLIGFAQVYWDPNRQATHDKIAATAVILDGRPPLGAVDGPVDPVAEPDIDDPGASSR